MKTAIAWGTSILGPSMTKPYTESGRDDARFSWPWRDERILQQCSRRGSQVGGSSNPCRRRRSTWRLPAQDQYPRSQGMFTHFWLEKCLTSIPLCLPYCFVHQVSSTCATQWTVSRIRIPGFQTRHQKLLPLVENQVARYYIYIYIYNILLPETAFIKI